MSLIDMHLHIKNRSPCSILSLNDLYNSLSERLYGICITDHWENKPIKNLNFDPFRVYFGVELTSIQGDILAYGINRLPSKNLDAKKIIDFIHIQGGIAVCAHPFSNRHLALQDNVFDFNFDAIELNGAIGNKYNEKAKYAATLMNLPTIGGSDAHSVKQLNSIATKFTISINTLDDIINAVKNKSCKAVKL